MFDADAYMKECSARLKQAFGERLLYVGLQGSYLRGEATEHSDIDVMVVLDGMTMQDLDRYRDIIEELPQHEKSCGFICGKDELARWNPLEICHLLHTTKDCLGELKPLVPLYSQHDIVNFIKYSIGNLEHEICHRYVHTDKQNSAQKLPCTYRSVFFILQNLYYLKDGVFYPTKNELMKHLDGEDREIMGRMMSFDHSADYDFNAAFAQLLTWCQKTLLVL